MPTAIPILSNNILIGKMKGSVIRARKLCMAPSSIGKKLRIALMNIARVTADSIRRIVRTVRVKIISIVKLRKIVFDSGIKRQTADARRLVSAHETTPSVEKQLRAWTSAA